METNPLTHSSLPGNGMAPGASPIRDAAAGAQATVDKMTRAADGALRNVKPGIERVAQSAHKMVDKAAGAAVPAAEWLGAKGESIKATQKQLLEGAGKYVSSNPMKVLGVALATGFLISRLVRK